MYHIKSIVLKPLGNYLSLIFLSAKIDFLRIHILINFHK